MRSRYLLLAAGLACGVMAQAADFPCKLTDYRIPDSKTLLVLCDAASPKKFDATYSLFVVQDESIVRPAVQEGKIDERPVESVAWLRFPLKAPLAPGTDYELQFSGNITVQAVREKTVQDVSQPFTKARIRFTTRPQVTVSEIPGAHAFGVQGHIAVDPASLGSGKLTQKNARGTFDDTHATFSSLGTDPDAIGALRIGPSASLAGPFKLDGLQDVLGQLLVADPTQHAPPISIPKAKADANYYFNFLHQAGWGITPTWVADIKLAPVLGHAVRGWYLAPSFVADVGKGSVGDTKATDLIKPSLGATRLFRTKTGFFEGVRVTPAFSYETDRENDKRNGLFDGDVRFYFKGLSNTKSQRALDKFLTARRTDPKIQPDDSTVQAAYGYSVQLFLGTEIGGAFTDVTAKSSDKSSSVTVPGYTIARLRPRVTSTLEWKRFTFNLSAVPRYLFSKENVTRENLVVQANGSGKEKIYLTTVQGWHPYAELGVNVALDPVGHFALGTTYKVGSQPVNFDRTNLFQSGLLIRF